MSRWIAMHCCEETDALQEKHPSAFLLLCQIVRRARWKDCPIMHLKAGEAFIGDWKKAGLRSPKAYEVAKKRLEMCGLVRFQGGNRGTRATILDSTIFSINEGAKGERTDKRAGSKGGADGEQRGTTHIDTKNTDTQNTKSKSIENTPLMIRVGKMLRRKPTTAWTAEERKFLKDIESTDEDEIELLERFYCAPIPKEEDYRRKTLARLLKHWRSEIDKARSWNAASDMAERGKFAGTHEDIDLPMDPPASGSAITEREWRAPSGRTLTKLAWE
jgi:hypothetical protein